MTDAPGAGTSDTSSSAASGGTGEVTAAPSNAGAPAAKTDPYLKSMLLGLIEDSYLRSGTFTQFAAEIIQVIAAAATVPVAFTEGFLKAYLSIDRIVETDEGHIKIIPKEGADIEAMMREVDELTAQVDPSAVYNPVVRANLTAVHEASGKAMRYDINTLTNMDDSQLMDVLRQMQRESEELQKQDQESGEAEASRDYIRAKLDTIRKNVRAFQVQQRHTLDVVDQGLSEAGAEPTANEPAPDPGEPAVE
jgi:hypothetical protein